MITFALYFTIGKTGDVVILKMPSQIWLSPHPRPRILGMPSHHGALPFFTHKSSTLRAWEVQVLLNGQN